MSWARYDGNFDDHPKVIAAIEAEPTSITLHTCANTYTHRNGLAGFVPAGYPRRLLGPKGARAAKALVSAGLWEACDGGWRFHDWIDYAPPALRGDTTPATPAADVSAKRREAGRLGGQRAAETRRLTREQAAAGASKQANGQANGQANQASAVANPSTDTDTETVATNQVGSTASGFATAREASKQASGQAKDTGAPAPQAEPASAGHWSLPPATMTGVELLNGYLDTFSSTLPRKEREWASAAIEKQLAEGATEQHVRTALELLRQAQRAGANDGAGLLPKYVRQAIDGIKPGNPHRGRPLSAAEEQRRQGLALIASETAAGRGIGAGNPDPALMQGSLYPYALDPPALTVLPSPPLALEGEAIHGRTA